MEPAVMAKPKPKQEPSLTPKRGVVSKRQTTAVAVRGTPEWRDWLDRGAEHCRTDSSKLIDIAVAHYLRGQGFMEPPPKR